MQYSLSRAKHTLRTIADELLEEQRVEYIDDGVLNVMAPAGFSHAGTIGAIRGSFYEARFSGQTSVDWEVHCQNFQFNLVNDPPKFFIPDLAISSPGSTSNRELRENLAMVVEVTSPDSPQTVRNDRGVKARQYAKGGVPCYLLVDQAEATWTLFALDDDWPGYRIHSSGEYGTPIELPEPFGFELPTDEWPPYSDED